MLPGSVTLPPGRRPIGIRRACGMRRPLGLGRRRAGREVWPGSMAAVGPASQPRSAVRDRAEPRGALPGPPEARPSARHQREEVHLEAGSAGCPSGSHRYSSRNSQTSFQRVLSSAVCTKCEARSATSWDDSWPRLFLLDHRFSSIRSSLLREYRAVPSRLGSRKRVTGGGDGRIAGRSA